MALISGGGGGGSSSSGMLEPVTVSTTGNIALTGLQTIDGYAVQTGDRVLVWQQTTASQNGIYVASAGAWARSADAATPAMFAGRLVATGYLGTTAYSVVFQEAGFAFGGDPTFYPSNPVVANSFAAPNNIVGTFQLDLRTLYTGNAAPNGGGVIWHPGGATYGSQGTRGVAAWETGEDGTERLGGIAAPTDGSIQTGQKAKWYDDTTGKPIERFKQKDAGGTLSAGVVLASAGNQDTVGAAGGAAALPATPTHYIKVRDVNGDLYVIPAYAAT